MTEALPVLMTTTQYAAHRRVTAGRISQLKLRLKEAGAVAADGKIDVVKADQYLGGVDAQVAVQAPAPVMRLSEEASLTHQRTKLTALNVEARELEVAELRGELVRKAEVETAAFETHRIVRDRLLGLPQEAAGQFVGLSDEGEASRLLESLITKCLHGLASEMAVVGSA